MNTIWVLAATLAVAYADVSLGYHYKVPQTSYGVPSYQFGESANHHLSGLSGSSGSSSAFDYKTHGPSGSHIGSTSFLSQSGHSGSGLHPSDDRVTSGSSSQYYPSISSTSGSSGLYYPSLSGSTLSGQYYPSTIDSSTVSSIGTVAQPINYLGGDLSHSLPSYNQYQNHYQNAAAYKYQQYYVQQKPAQVYKHFYVHSAPEEPEIPKPRQPIVLPAPQKHYKIIFVKTPSQQSRAPQVITVPQQNEEKTIVYVLSKKPEEQQDIIVPKIEQKPPTKPEVYFIKYKNKEDSQSVISNIVNDYNKGQSVSFSGIGDGAQGDYDSSSQSSFGSNIQSVYGSGSENDDSGSSIFNTGSHTIPSSIGHAHYSEQISNSPVEVPVPVNGFGSDSFGLSHLTSGPQTIGAGSTDLSSLSGVPSISLASIPESSSTASAIASGSGLASTTASSISYDDAKLISTSQGVPHETYGPPKFRVN